MSYLTSSPAQLYIITLLSGPNQSVNVSSLLGGIFLLLGLGGISIFRKSDVNCCSAYMDGDQDLIRDWPRPWEYDWSCGVGCHKNPRMSCILSDGAGMVEVNVISSTQLDLPGDGDIQLHINLVTMVRPEGQRAGHLSRGWKADKNRPNVSWLFLISSVTCLSSSAVVRGWLMPPVSVCIIFWLTGQLARPSALGCRVSRGGPHLWMWEVIFDQLELE